jgi:hypothetical protein|nr:MAG: putative major capsid protein [Lake Baikal virophage 4]
MSSADFSKVKVIDDVLATTDSVKYSVIKGAQNITPGKYTAISNSNSSVTWNLQTPSEATILSRRIMIRNTISLSISGTIVGADPNALLVNYGLTEALGPYPFQSLCNTIQMTINNNTISQNMRDVMFALLRFGDRREAERYNNATPVGYDSYWNYSDAVGSNNNPMAAFNDLAADESYQGRGVSRITSITGNIPGPGLKNIVLTFETIEPLLLSPLIFSDPKYNNQGFYGIQVLSVVANVGSPNRILRSAQRLINGNATGLSVSLLSPQAFVDPQLLIQYYTRQPSDLVPARNVVPFAEYPRYLSSGQGTIPAGSFLNPAVAGTSSFTPGTLNSFASQTISLNSIPDRLIIFARKVLANQTPYDADCFFPISRILVNFNNKSGLLSSATNWDLWRMSVESGSNATWSEFSGLSQASAATGIDQSGFAGVKQIPTSGAPLVLSMGRHIELDDVFAPGSIGQFQLQFQVDINNFSTDVYAPGTWELVLITQNTGVFVLERGTSQTYTAILSRSDVLAASAQPGYKASDVVRMVGGGVEDGYKDLMGMGLAGSGFAGSGSAGSGNAGSGNAGSGNAGSGNAGSGFAGSGKPRISKHLQGY